MPMQGGLQRSSLLAPSGKTACDAIPAGRTPRGRYRVFRVRRLVNDRSRELRPGKRLYQANGSTFGRAARRRTDSLRSRLWAGQLTSVWGSSIALNV